MKTETIPPVRVTPEFRDQLQSVLRDGETLSAFVELESGLDTLARFPFTCRRAANDPFLRGLVIPFGHSGYVALFEIVDATTVSIAAVRHQREDDYD